MNIWKCIFRCNDVIIYLQIAFCYKILISYAFDIAV